MPHLRTSVVATAVLISLVGALWFCLKQLAFAPTPDTYLFALIFLTAATILVSITLVAAALFPAKGSLIVAWWTADGVRPLLAFALLAVSSLFAFSVIKLVSGQVTQTWLLLAFASGLFLIVGLSIAFAYVPLLDEARPEKIIVLDQSGKDNISQVVDIFRASRQRLARELVRLQRNSLLNLVLGCIFSGVGLLVAFTFLQSYAPERTSALAMLDTVDQVTILIARALSVIFFQILAFFFLRLYVSNEFDVKHTKNELTNVELWWAATQMPQIATQAELARDMAMKLLSMERNFTLKKDEKLAASDLDLTHNDIIELLKSAMPRKKDE